MGRRELSQTDPGSPACDRTEAGSPAQGGVSQLGRSLECPTRSVRLRLWVSQDCEGAGGSGDQPWVGTAESPSSPGTDRPTVSGPALAPSKGTSLYRVALKASQATRPSETWALWPSTVARALPSAWLSGPGARLAPPTSSHVLGDAPPTAAASLQPRALTQGRWPPALVHSALEAASRLPLASLEASGGRPREAGEDSRAGYGSCRARASPVLQGGPTQGPSVPPVSGPPQEGGALLLF